MSKLKIGFLVLVASLFVLLISSCSSSPEPVESSSTSNEVSQEQKAPAIPHVLVNRNNCLGCHGEGTLLSVPTDHQGRDNDSCTSCHELTSNPASYTAEAIPHTLEGRENCLGCHASGTSEGIPSSHQGRTTDTCTACHQPGGDD